MSAILKVYLDNEAAIKRHVSRFCDSADEINEVAQEAFMRAFAAEQRYEITEPKAFLYKVARNVALGELRRKGNESTPKPADSVASDLIIDESQPLTEDWLDSRRKLALFSLAVAQLPPKCRKAFLLRHVDGLKYKQIANRMDISVSTVEKHIANALLKCQVFLENRGYKAAEFGARKDRPGVAAGRKKTNMQNHDE